MWPHVAASVEKMCWQMLPDMLDQSKPTWITKLAIKKWVAGVGWEGCGTGIPGMAGLKQQHWRQGVKSSHMCIPAGIAHAQQWRESVGLFTCRFTHGELASVRTQPFLPSCHQPLAATALVLMPYVLVPQV
jgi:hypothetical protein